MRSGLCLGVVVWGADGCELLSRSALRTAGIPK
jgi:hypothetical protein